MLELFGSSSEDALEEMSFATRALAPFAGTTVLLAADDDEDFDDEDLDDDLDDDDLDADDDAVLAALQHAGAADLPAELDTLLSKGFEGGVDLSGGQWQRVALARAVLGARADEAGGEDDAPTLTRIDIE